MRKYLWIACISISFGMIVEKSCFGQTPAAAIKKVVDPSGSWRWEYEFQGQQVKDRLELDFEKKIVTGKFIGTNATAEIRDAKIEGDQLSLSTQIDVQGTKVDLKFSGTVKGDELDGKVIVEVDGQTQEFPWAPKRSVQPQDLQGEWKLEIETPDGQELSPVLTLKVEGEKVTGTYVLDDGKSIEPQAIKIVDNQLTFSIETKVDGANLIAKFKGRPYGNKMQGKIAYDLSGNTGEIDFLAKRSKPADKK